MFKVYFVNIYAVSRSTRLFTGHHFSLSQIYTQYQCFFFWGDAGVRVPLNILWNLTGESKNVKILEFPLNQLQTYDGYLCDLLSFM
jgi:hypothetical protein